MVNERRAGPLQIGVLVDMSLFKAFNVYFRQVSLSATRWRAARPLRRP